MMPPTSIDGTDITGATIDGTDVQEITVDGQTVFSAQTLPVAYSNLVAWYPFDSATYGGSNADDVTAIIGGSGDDTAYDGTVNGASHQSSGGNKDINAGDSSSYYEFSSNDNIDTGTKVLADFGANSNPFSYSVWFKWDNILDNDYKPIMGDNFGGGCLLFHWRSGENQGLSVDLNANGTRERYTQQSNMSNGEWFHGVVTFDGSSTTTLYVDGVDVTNFRQTKPLEPTQDFYIGNYGESGYDAAPHIDDVRVYNKELSSSEVNQIFNNTKPSSKP
jgi:hypothetical protein